MLNDSSRCSGTDCSTQTSHRRFQSKRTDNAGSLRALPPFLPQHLDVIEPFPKNTIMSVQSPASFADAVIYFGYPIYVKSIVEILEITPAIFAARVHHLMWFQDCARVTALKKTVFFRLI